MRFVQRYHDHSAGFWQRRGKRLADAAREHRIHVVMGCSGRDGGNLYISQLLINDAGRTIAQRRSSSPPTSSERCSATATATI